MKYAQGDSYCYEGTEVLINILGLTEQDELDAYEEDMSTLRMLDAPEGDFGVEHLQHIHKYLFQDVYEWAGKFRNCTLSKGNFPFAQPQYIEREVGRVCANIHVALKKEMLTHEQIIDIITHTTAELNAIHPFREGNGRTIREFIQQLAIALRHFFHIARIDPKEWLAASIASFYGYEAPLREIMEQTLEEL